MASSVGALSALGLFKETTYGTGGAPTVWLPFTSESFRDGPEAIQEAEMRGILDQSPMYKGMQVVAGQLSGVVYPDTFGHILRAAIGPDTVTGSGPYVHTFNPLQSPFGAAVALPSYSIQVQRQGAQTKRYVGMQCTSLTLSFSQGGLLKFDSSWIGRDATAPTAGSPSISAVQPFQLSAAITRSATAYADIMEYSVNIETPVEPVRTINNSALIERMALNGHRTIGLSGSADYFSETLYDDFKAWSSLAWAITHTQSASAILAMTIPAGINTDFNAAAGGPGRLGADFNISAMYDSGTARAIQFVLTNSVSGVY